mgnify:CR=1 FL=1
MRIYDISLPIDQRTPIYPGDPAIQIEAHASIDRGDVANVTALRFGAHTGTHVDAPAHFIASGAGVCALSLEAMIGCARVIEIPADAQAVLPEHLTEIGESVRVLFKTRNSSLWTQSVGSFRTDYVYLSSEAARVLVQRGVRLVGIDYLSVERYGAGDFSTHLTLLANGVVIVEGLDLSAVAPGTYDLICLPLRIAGGAGDGAPARVVLIESDGPK